eukprot:3927686-Rhodomonas_salina.6
MHSALFARLCESSATAQSVPAACQTIPACVHPGVTSDDRHVSIRDGAAGTKPDRDPGPKPDRDADLVLEPPSPLPILCHIRFFR